MQSYRKCMFTEKQVYRKVRAYRKCSLTGNAVLQDIDMIAEY